MNERQQGTVKEYKRDRGFGFIRPDAGGSDVFLHVTELRRHQRLPKAGDRVSYIMIRDRRGRIRAKQARLVGLKPSWNVQAGIVAWCFGLEIVLMALLGLMPMEPLLIGHFVVMLIMGPATFEAYGIDKRRAELGKSRIPEITLHTMELLGGWPGALFAQHMFRHKLQKLQYQIVYSAIVFFNIVMMSIFI